MSRPKKQVSADYQAAIDRFVSVRNPRDREAQKWLSSFLKHLDWSALKAPPLWGFQSDELGTLPPKLQIALLKSCIELMVRLREERRSAGAPGRGKGFRI